MLANQFYNFGHQIVITPLFLLAIAILIFQFVGNVVAKATEDGIQSSGSSTSTAVGELPANLIETDEVFQRTVSDKATFESPDQFMGWPGMKDVVRPVGRLDIDLGRPDPNKCTAFLVAPRYILTALHCLSGSSLIRFNAERYYERVQGITLWMNFVAPNRFKKFRISTELVDGNWDNDLDYVLLKVPDNEQDPSEEFGFLKLSKDEQPQDGAPYWLPQHPNGEILQVPKLKQCETADPVIEGPRYRHFCPTEPGSSGAPMVHNFGRPPVVIGMHYAAKRYVPSEVNPPGSPKRPKFGHRIVEIVNHSPVLQEIVSEYQQAETIYPETKGRASVKDGKRSTVSFAIEPETLESSSKTQGADYQGNEGDASQPTLSDLQEKSAPGLLSNSPDLLPVDIVDESIGHRNFVLIDDYAFSFRVPKRDRLLEDNDNFHHAKTRTNDSATNRSVVDSGQSCVRINIPSGYVTDLSSVPAIALMFVSSADIVEASLLHDWLYRVGLSSHRSLADYLFRELLLISDVEPEVVNELFKTVRLFGKSSYGPGEIVTFDEGTGKIARHNPENFDIDLIYFGYNCDSYHGQLLEMLDRAFWTLPTE